MKSGLGIFICLGFCCVLSPASAAGPVFDPFLESFYVGKYTESENIVIVNGYPRDLFLPAVVDTAWIRQALSLMDSKQGNFSPQPVIRAWLQAPGMKAELQAWRSSRRKILTLMIADKSSLASLAGIPQGHLYDEALCAGFFLALAQGDTCDAVECATELAANIGPDPTQAAARFVWDLRVRALQEVGGAKPTGPRELWTTLFALGPFDSQSGFAIWGAHRKARKLPLLTPDFSSRAQAIFLAGLRTSRLRSQDIDASGFAWELKAGLGAKLLRGQDRLKYMKRFARPPWGFAAQGWWVSGLRSSVHGQAAAYERLSHSEELRSGWRMDLLRRASELRLLKGQWTQGLQDLKQAVGLARYGAGSEGLRRRLRQWLEQALALAVAQEESARAAFIVQQGDRLPPSESKVFQARIQSWYLADPGSLHGLGQSPPEAEVAVRAGLAKTMAPVGVPVTLPSPRAWRLRNWEEWIQVGLGLQEGSSAKVKRWPDFSSLETPASPDQARNQALLAVANELGGEALPAKVLDMVLEHDVFLQAAPEVGAPPSSWPLYRDLCQRNPNLWHGLLGLALGQQDLRAVVGLVSLPVARSLPSEQKLTFLYPVPTFGPTWDSLQKSHSEVAMLLAVARNESLFDAGARSRAGALGWMQIMPFHYRSGGALPGPVHWSNPAVSIAKGDELLGENNQRFGGDPYRVLAAYNAGPSAARRWEKQLGRQAVSRDIYLAWIGYPETRRYVEKVLRDRMVYSQILGRENNSAP